MVTSPHVLTLGKALYDDAVMWRGRLSAFRRRLGLGGQVGWKARDDPVRGRRRALWEETWYWRDWLASSGGNWPDDYAHRFNPCAEINDPALRRVIAELPRETVAMLDVGSGPASSVGYRFPGRRVVLEAVDPLADRYNRLLDEAGVAPPVRPRPVHGERLIDHFGPDRFDVAYSRNALDHAVDPVLIVENMLGVVRAGGHVVLRHSRNEGIRSPTSSYTSGTSTSAAGI
jgi:SAM-dependent methyltransferase